MRFHSRLAIFGIAVLFLSTMPAHGQSSQSAKVDWKVGPRITIDAGDIDDTAIGGVLRLHSPSFPVQGSGAFDLYLSEKEATTFTVDLNGQIPVEVERWFVPYVGAGFGITRISGRSSGESITDVGFNLMGGAEVDLRFITPFLQAQLTLGDRFDRLGLNAGLLIDI